MHKFRMQKNNPIHQGESIASDKHQVKQCSCPHWCACSRSCQLVKDGLFMPIDQHVVAYCLSSNHSMCSYYQLLAGAEDKAGQDQAASANRRRSIRIPSRHSFRFSEITGHDSRPGLREDDAWTIDLSDHGIRFTSRQLLNLDTEIRFLLEADDRAAQVEGIGKVVWCEPLENTALFHAGIVFTDPPEPARLPHHRSLHQA